MPAKIKVYDVITGRARRILPHAGIATCGTCGRSWDDDKCTSMTPAPAGRCPFEYQHKAPKPGLVAVCATCGSRDVKADSFAAWSVEQQAWETCAVMDSGHCCEDCGEECDIEFIPAP